MRLTGRLTRAVLLLLIAWAFLLINVGEPFYGRGAYSAAGKLVTVRNYQLYGAPAVGLLQVRNPVPTTPDDFNYYNRWPPLGVWLTALGSVPLGLNDVSGRVITAFFMLFAIAGFYPLARQLLPERMAWWATVFFALAPITLYYGQIPGYDTWAMPFLVFYLLFFGRWLRRPTRANWAWMVLLACLGGWTMWPIQVFVGFVSLIGLWLMPRRRWPALIGAVMISAAVTALVLVYYQWQWPGTLDNLREQLTYRTSAATGDGSTFTLLEWLSKVMAETALLVTFGAAALALYGWRVAFSLRDRRLWAMLAALLVAPVTYHLLFRNASYIHDVYRFYFLPLVALLAGMGYVGLHQVRGRWRRWARPLADGALLAAVLTGLFTLYAYHNTNVRPALAEVTAYLRENVSADVIVLTNISENDLPVLEYYGENVVKTDVTPAQALRRFGNATAPLLYVHCPLEEPAEPSASASIVADWQPYALHEGALCRYYRFNP